MRDYVPPLHWTTMVPATMSYTVLLCWKKRSVMKTGKRKAMEKFLLSARTVDLRNTKITTQQMAILRTPIQVFYCCYRHSCTIQISGQSPRWMDHSRREGNIRRWDDQDPIGSDQSGCVTRDHSQSKQELPWCGATSTPDTDCLIGQEGQNTHR